MENHYVTFGQVHTHRVQGKTLDCDCVAVYKANSWKEGRDKAFELFGDKFFTDYHGEEFDQDDMKYFPRGFIYLD